MPASNLSALGITPIEVSLAGVVVSVADPAVLANTIPTAFLQMGMDVALHASNLANRIIMPSAVYACNAAVHACNAAVYSCNAAVYSCNAAVTTSNWGALDAVSDVLHFRHKVALDADVASHILPTQDAQFDLGAAGASWRSLYVSGDTIYIGSNTIKSDSLTGHLSVGARGSSNASRVVVNEIQLGQVGSSNVILRADDVSGALQVVLSYKASNGTTYYSSNSIATFNSNLPSMAAFASNLAPNVTAALSASLYGSNTATTALQAATYGSNMLSSGALAYSSNAATFSSNAIATSASSVYASNAAATSLAAAAYSCNLAVSSSNLAVSSCNLAAYSCNLAVSSLAAAAYSCNLAVSSSNSAASSSAAAAYSCNLAASSLAASAYSCNLAVSSLAAAAYSSNLGQSVSFTSNAAVYASNVASYCSNAGVGGGGAGVSGPAVTYASNTSYAASNWVYQVAQPAEAGMVKLLQPTEFTSNVTVLNNGGTSNSVALTVNGAMVVTGDIIAGGDLFCFADMSALASNASIASSLYPSAEFASNVSVYASNVSVYASNASVYASNASVYASNSSVYASNSSVYASNASVYASNSSSYASNFAAGPEVLQSVTFASNAAAAAETASNAALSYAQIRSEVGVVGLASSNASTLAVTTSNWLYTLAVPDSGTVGSCNIIARPTTMMSNLSILNGGSSSETALFVTGDVLATGDVMALSDARVKSELAVVPDAMSRLRGLTGYTFVMRGDTATGRRRMGLLAQDVQSVAPEAVSTSDGLLSVSYGNLVALLVEAVKELDARLTRTLMA